MANVTRKKPMAEINVVPYIDVMLVLLVIFMITAPLLMQGVKVDLPQSSSTPIDSKDEEPLIVSLEASGQYYINVGRNQDAPRPLNEIVDTVGKILKQKPTTPVLVWGDRKVPYGSVVTLMAELQIAGAESVGLVTEPGRPES